MTVYRYWLDKDGKKTSEMDSKWIIPGFVTGDGWVIDSDAFSDSNVILYGHHMQDMSMFATLKYWMKQDYYEEHPVMWLLTPEQNYRIEIFAAYETQADSETYTIFRGASPQFEEYLRTAAEKSSIRTDVELDPEAHYVLLSTCAYSNELARTVVHGKLIPVE